MSRTEAPLQNRANYNWQHGVGDVLNALIDAGLQIEFVHEFPYTFWKQFPFMRRGRDGWWHLTRNEGFVPLMWSVKATKPW